MFGEPRMRDAAAMVGLLLAMTLIGWCLQPGAEQAAPAPVVVRDPVAVVEDISPAELGVPLPAGARVVGRVARRRDEHGAMANGLFHVPGAAAGVAEFYRRAWPQAEVRTSPGEDEGRAIFLIHDGARRLTVRVGPEGQGARVMIVVQETVAEGDQTMP